MKCQATMKTDDGIRLRCDLERHDGETHEWVLDGGATVLAVVHRADGTTEDLGEIGRVSMKWEAN